jgi:hypothetical protein
VRVVFAILFLVCTVSGYSQIVLVPIQKEINQKKISSGRTKDVTPVELPFWDDFSAERDGYVNPALWEYGQSVWVNSGMGINAPSLNVVTLDGLDSLGKPYNVNDVLAKGYADKLISAPIRMDLPTATERLAIALTFFYEFQGNGEPPDAGDILTLAFKNDLNQWEVVWSIENTGTLLKDKFIPVTIPITNSKFFHDKFQFRFQNFARLSGPYDTWHVDYIYISNGKSQTNPVFPLFPDRTISTPITSLFPNYRAMPIKHFFTNTTTNTIRPTIAITNLRQDQVAGNGQPVSYFSRAKITMYKNGAPVELDPILDNNVNIGSELFFTEQEVVTLQTTPDPGTFDPAADSIHIKLTVGFDTGDDKIKTPTEGDYDFNVFNPIVFKTNDSLSARSVLSNYYAYDDGEAEYGAGLNQPGAQLAYEFTMQTNQSDTLVAVDMYFPRFGDESNQIIKFQVLNDLTNSASSILYIGNIPIQRNTLNKFWRVPLIEPAMVKGKFYVGWQQTSSAVIAVGLDKNTDSGNKIFSNINGSWQQNISLKGSLMIRPVFGKGKGGPITEINRLAAFSVYPNPNPGTFYISAIPENVVMYDLSGRKVAITVEKETETTKITMTQPTTGLYLLRLYSNSQWTSTKVIVR